MDWAAIVKRNYRRSVSCVLIKKRKDMAEIQDNEEVDINGANEELRKAKACWEEHIEK